MHYQRIHNVIKNDQHKPQVFLHLFYYGSGLIKAKVKQNDKQLRCQTILLVEVRKHLMHPAVVVWLLGIISGKTTSAETGLCPAFPF